ncbi:hypothetical protein C8R45DRAFT_1181047 [Mycena sanguinolenta]|nr:hypothetical protein C8R45DRAFT_1181047 [Mycena sanguinolenta]
MPPQSFWTKYVSASERDRKAEGTTGRRHAVQSETKSQKKKGIGTHLNAPAAALNVLPINNRNRDSQKFCGGVSALQRKARSKGEEIGEREWGIVNIAGSNPASARWSHEAHEVSIDCPNPRVHGLARTERVTDLGGFLVEEWSKPKEQVENPEGHSCQHSRGADRRRGWWWRESSEVEQRGSTRGMAGRGYKKGREQLFDAGRGRTELGHIGFGTSTEQTRADGVRGRRAPLARRSRRTARHILGSDVVDRTDGDDPNPTPIRQTVRAACSLDVQEEKM